MSSKLKWIFFDVGDTLANELPEHEKRFNTAKSEIEQSIGRNICFDEFYKKMCEGCSNAKHSPFYYALRSYGVKTKYPYTNDGEVVFPDADKVLAELSRSYRLGIIANQNAGLCERLEKFGILKYFEAVFGSDDIGISKPDVRIYTNALEKTACPPELSVMIGDRLDNDIAPAKAAGMYTVRILHNCFAYSPIEREEQRPDAVAANLCDVVRAIAEIEEKIQKI